MINPKRGNSKGNAKLHRYNSFAKLQASSKSVRAKIIKRYRDGYFERGRYLYKSSSIKTTEVKKVETEQKHEKWLFQNLQILRHGLSKSLKTFWNITGFKEKTIWDIFQLSAVPLALFVGTQIISNENKKQQMIAAEDKANQEILGKYIDEMAKLLDRDLLQVAELSDKRFITAQVKTVVALQSLDPMRQQLVLQLLEAAKLNILVDGNGVLYQARMSKANFEKADLSGANLRRANLSKANIQKAKFLNVDLTNANVENADLEDADLMGANLYKANFFRANLTNAFFSEAILTNADLSYANLTNAILQDSKLRNADLSYAQLTNAFLGDANLTNANLTNANLTNADLSGANLTNANLTNAILQDSKLKGSKLKGSKLNGADLKDVILDDDTELDSKWKLVYDLVNNGGVRKKLINTDLSGASLFGASLFGANLTDADLKEADLSSADLRRANLSDALLQDSSLNNAKLNNANLDRTTFINTDISFSKLRGSTFKSAIILSSDLRESENLTLIQLKGANNPLICNSPLPENIKIELNRDCDKLAPALHKRYPNDFSSLDEAEKFIQEQRQKKWD